MSSDKNNMRNIVVIGSCSVDFTTYSSRLPKPGETLHGTKFTTSYGGKGANQCVAAAKLGGKTFMICRLGDDQWGQQYKDYLGKSGVDVTYTSITKDTSTGIAQISVAENGENQIVIVAGANDHLSKDDVDTAKEVIRNAYVLVAQLETPLSTTLEAFKLSNGIKLLNAAPARTDIEEILPLCSILCVNESEASMLAGFDVDLYNAKVALQKLLQSGCETVIITLGHQGAVYGSKHNAEYYHVFCEKVTAVDTTGAGDAFVGALATYLTSHKDYAIHQIIGAACDIATMSVLKEGTQTSYPTDYKPFTKEYPYELL
ncbi:ribokinase [Aricia agestis]|uniref:ribokinase n=1 Tax=Aricia agestis TaxID=91739 RepID=UPI001C209012|nr:ribokinase [Aricia agestis]